MPFSINGLFHRLLCGHVHHYAQQLPGQLTLPVAWLLRRWFANVRFGADQTRTLKQAGTGARMVYITRHPSRLEALFGHIRFQQIGLPHPTLTPGQRFWLLQPVARMVRIVTASLSCWLRLRGKPDPVAGGHFVRQIQAGETLWLPLVAPRDMFSRPRRGRCDPLTVLIEAHRSGDRPVVAAPVLMFYDRRPQAAGGGLIEMILGPLQPPGRLRRLATLMIHPARAFMEVGAPLALENYLARPQIATLSIESQALALRRELLERIARLQQSVTGPVPRSLLESRHAILTSGPLQEYLVKSARRRNIALYRAQREAAVYLKEIAARPAPLASSIGMSIAGSLVRRMFDGLSINNEMLRRVREAAMQGPVIFTPCHRSHMDTLLVGLALHHHNISLPLVFAGQNLAFWPLGPVARRMGAFFVRRTFKGKVLYAKVMEAYIRWLLQERYNILVYIEGTRSRSGRLLLPQLGMLAMLLGAVRDGACREMSFVPVHIGYDRVPEESAYLHETRGGRKAPESARQLLGARRALRRRYGRIYLKFGDPIALSRVTAKEPTALAEMTSHQFNRLCRGLGQRIMSAIDRATVITPHALAAGVILGGGRPLLRTVDFTAGVETLLAYAGAVGLPLADTLSVDPMSAVDAALADFAARRWVEPALTAAPDDPPAAYRVISSRRLALAYYQNTAMGRFVPAAYTALLILSQGSFQFSAAHLHRDYSDLQQLLAREFPPDPDLPPAFLVRKTVKAFIDEALLVPHPTLPDTYRLTAAGYRKLRCFAGLVAAVLEGYAIALEVLVQPESTRRPAKDPVRRIRTAGLRRVRRGLVRRPESLALGNLTNAVAFFAAQGIRGPADAGRSDPYKAILQRYMTLLAA